MTDPDNAHGIVAYDLPIPRKSLLAAAMEPWPCPVCGLEQQPEPLHVALWGRQNGKRSAYDRHASCRRTIAGWDAQVKAINDDPDYAAAVDAVNWAQDRADTVWEERLRGLGLPEWYVQRKIAFRGDTE